jgi:hypothetical protein
MPENVRPDFIGTKTVRCVTKDRDRYQRLVAICNLGDQSINAWMVRQGWAVDYRQYSKGEYRAEEAQAKQNRLGVWRGEFVMPWDWRQGKRIASPPSQISPRPTEDSQTTDCRIKGNISSKGARIYHVPGGQFYVWSFHKTDADTWPSALHGHEYDKNLKLDAVTGHIYDAGTRERLMTLKPQALSRIQEELRGSKDFVAMVEALVGNE